MRIKTEAEFIEEFGPNWIDVVDWEPTRMNIILGKYVKFQHRTPDHTRWGTRVGVFEGVWIYDTYFNYKCYTDFFLNF